MRGRWWVAQAWWLGATWIPWLCAGTGCPVCPQGCLVGWPSLLSSTGQDLSGVSHTLFHCLCPKKQYCKFLQQDWCLDKVKCFKGLGNFFVLVSRKWEGEKNKTGRKKQNKTKTSALQDERIFFFPLAKWILKKHISYYVFDPRGYPIWFVSQFSRKNPQDISKITVKCLTFIYNRGNLYCQQLVLRIPP